MSEALLHRHNPGRAQLTDRASEFRGLTLLELARHALDRRGISTRGKSKMELATEALIGRSGLHSTSDFPLILANVANKTLRAAYDTTPRTFTAWVRQAVITDFKPVARNQLGGAPDLLRVPESGEFTYGTIGESREVYALVTYGRIVGITRQTLINDDLDAFTRIPSAFGAAAADLESDLVYSIFSTNPNMADGNPLSMPPRPTSAPRARSRKPSSPRPIVSSATSAGWKGAKSASCRATSSRRRASGRSRRAKTSPPPPRMRSPGSMFSPIAWNRSRKPG
jgi:hypothetical protein